MRDGICNINLTSCDSMAKSNLTSHFIEQIQITIAFFVSTVNYPRWNLVAPLL